MTFWTDCCCCYYYYYYYYYTKQFSRLGRVTISLQKKNLCARCEGLYRPHTFPVSVCHLTDSVKALK